MSRLNKKSGLASIIILLFLAQACKIEPAKNKDNSTETLVVCTTGMLADAVNEIGKGQLKVIGLMGPGVDPHLYKATQGDLEILSKADIVVYNGLHLEGKMGEIFEKLGRSKKVIAAADGIPAEKLINNTDFQGAQDPHIWFDVLMWKEVVKHLTKELSAFDSSSKKEFEENRDQYLEKLNLLDQELKEKIKELPAEDRILITAHDAFAYFGRAYGFQVRGLQGISTVSEYGLKDIADLVQFICDRKIKAVFVESSVSERSLKAVVEGCQANKHDLQIGGTLYSDAMGKRNSPEGNYIGMFRHNVNTIVNSLKKEK